MPSKLLIAVFFIRVMFSCRKEETSNNTVVIDLAIVSTTTMASQMQQQGIRSQVKCIQTSTCEKFLNMEIKEAGTREFAIKAKGTSPFSKNGIACGLIVGYKDTAITIAAATKGQYLLHFYNKDTLFKTDTVQVN